MAHEVWEMSMGDGLFADLLEMPMRSRKSGEHRVVIMQRRTGGSLRRSAQERNM